MSEIRRPYLENLRVLSKNEGHGKEKPYDDLVEEHYEAIKQEWNQWKESSREEQFDVLRTLDHIGFFDIKDQNGNRLYTDDELERLVNDDGMPDETKLFDLFLREADRRSKLNDEGYSKDDFYKTGEGEWNMTTEEPRQLDFKIFPPSDKSGPVPGAGAHVERREDMNLKHTLRQWLSQEGFVFEEAISAPLREGTMRTADYSVFFIYTDSSKKHLTKAVYVSDQYGRATVVAHDLEYFEKGAWENIGRMNEQEREEYMGRETEKEHEGGYHFESVRWQGGEKEWFDAVSAKLGNDYVYRSTTMSSGLRDSFEKGERPQPYTPETALSKLEEAFYAWLALPEDERKIFNTAWLGKIGTVD